MVETASLISCTYPTTATKNACFFYHCTDKGNHFFSLEENTGMRLIVKYLLPCSAMFYMPFINSVKFIFATKEMSYESGRCKGVVLPQKERSRCQRELPRNGKVECRQVLRGGIQCETVGTTYDVALRSCYG